MLGIKINGVSLPVDPFAFKVTISDLDDGETTTRATDGTLTRDRIAVKRQIQMTWNAVSNANASTILQLIKDPEFEIYYPDPEIGTFVTKTFYAGNRPAAIAVVKPTGLWWSGMDFTFVEI